MSSKAVRNSDVRTVGAVDWWRRADEFEPLRDSLMFKMPEEFRIGSGDALGMLDPAYGSQLAEPKAATEPLSVEESDVAMTEE